MHEGEPVMSDFATIKTEIQKGVRAFKAFENGEQVLSMLEGLEQNEKQLREAISASQDTLAGLNEKLADKDAEVSEAEAHVKKLIDDAKEKVEKILNDAEVKAEQKEDHLVVELQTEYLFLAVRNEHDGQTFLALLTRLFYRGIESLLDEPSNCALFLRHISIMVEVRFCQIRSSSI
jgi:septal ring factor EnvC (AmiA/AmiB activator)